MKKFEGWRTEELRHVAACLAEHQLLDVRDPVAYLYLEVIREIRNRRVKEELFQMKLNLELTDQEDPA